MSGQEPIRRDPKYRPNYNRSVTISGIIDDSLVSRLLPEIVRLQSTSREPITMYIDSPGGDTESARLLLDALRASDQDRSEPCRLITVALSEASSAASDMLMAGEYALAYPFSKILCHGTRIRPQSAFTKEQAASYAEYMAGQDEGFAITLARNCIDRFMFRFSTFWLPLDKADKGSPGLFGYEDSVTAKSIADSMISILKLGYVNDGILEQLSIAGQTANDVASFAKNSNLMDALKSSNEMKRKASVRTAILGDALTNISIDPSFASMEVKYSLLCDFFEHHHREMIAKLKNLWLADFFNDPSQDPAFLKAGRISFASEQDRWKSVFQYVDTMLFFTLVPLCLLLPSASNRRFPYDCDRSLLAWAHRRSDRPRSCVPAYPGRERARHSLFDYSGVMKEGFKESLKS
jgi:ATP-dependent protease ClpP protease subunit